VGTDLGLREIRGRLHEVLVKTGEANRSKGIGQAVSRAREVGEGSQDAEQLVGGCVSAVGVGLEAARKRLDQRSWQVGAQRRERGQLRATLRLEQLAHRATPSSDGASTRQELPQDEAR